MIYLGECFDRRNSQRNEAVEGKSKVNEPLQRPGWDSEKEGWMQSDLMTRKTLFFLVALSDVNVLPSFFSGTRDGVIALVE